MHLLSVGYFEPGTGAQNDPIATRWKPTRGIRPTHLMTEKLDEL